jgi:Family of unknown function (DUF6516)
MVEITLLARIIDIEYHTIVQGASQVYHDKIRAYLLEGSFIDIWFSKKMAGRFSYHWERGPLDGTIYRHDDFPDPRWKSVSTYPKHFHDGSQAQVSESSIDDDPLKGLRQFMDFVRKKILNAVPR